MPEAKIDLTGGTISAGGDVILTADANANMAMITPSDLGGAVDASVVVGVPSAEIILDGTTLTAANLTVTSTAMVTVGFTDAADGMGESSTNDAAVTVVVVEGGSSTTVDGASDVMVSGAVTLSAVTTVDVDSIADGSGGSLGATLAVTEVGIDTTVSVGGSSSIGPNGADNPDSIWLSSTLTADVVTESISTAGGAEENMGSDPKSEQRLKDPNDDGMMDDRAQTDTSGGSNINFAGAVAVSVYLPTTSATIATTGNLTTDGALTVSANSTDTVLTRADGSTTGSGGTGVGVAVAVGVGDASVRAVLEDGNITSSGVIVTAGLAGANTFTVDAISGSGDASDFAVAGSLAIQVLTTTVEAVVDGTIDLNGSDLTLTAGSTTSAITHARPNETAAMAADKGVGLSVALYIGTHNTTAAVLDDAQVNNGDDLTFSATGNHTDLTTAEAGGEGGGVGIGGAVSIFRRRKHHHGRTWQPRGIDHHDRRRQCERASPRHEHGPGGRHRARWGYFNRRRSGPRLCHQPGRVPHPA